MASQTEQLSFLSGANAAFVAELYASYLGDPGSVDASWAGFFATLHDDARAVLGEMRRSSAPVTEPRATAAPRTAMAMAATASTPM